MEYTHLKCLIKDLNIKSIREWKNWVRSNRHVYPDIPLRPETAYKNEFEGYIIFLNSNRVKRKEYWDFNTSKKYLQEFGFTSKEFRKFIKVNKDLPIPSAPNKVYSEFTSWPDFLSTINVSKLHEYYSYVECLEFLKDKNIQSVVEFRKHRVLNKWYFIPSNPDKYFKEFESYSIFLSNNSISNHEKTYFSYDESKKFLKDKNLSSLLEYKKFLKSNNIDFLPKSPFSYYKYQYISNADYLSNENISSQLLNLNYLPIEKAKIFLENHSITTYTEYLYFIKENNILFLPKKPWISYKNKGWISIEHFFGRTLKVSHGESFIEKFLKENDINYYKQKKFDECKNIRKLPFDFYLQDMNTCIEYDGKQHTHPITLFGGDDGLVKRIKNDKIKEEYCRNNNIRLIRVNYKDNIKESLKNFILK